MAYAALMPTKLGLEGSHDQIHRLRTTTTCMNVDNLSKVFVRGAHADKLKVKGPVKMPPKVLHIKSALSCVEEKTGFKDFFAHQRF